jgi:hypothetical protein
LVEGLKRAKVGEVTQKWAAERMGVNDLWVRRLLVEMKEEGDAIELQAKCTRDLIASMFPSEWPQPKSASGIRSSRPCR